MIRDFRLAVRSLRRAPLFTLTALVTLAVGIGANTAIFSVVDAVLLEPLPYEDAEELVGLWHEAPGLDFSLLNQSPATYMTYRDDARTLSDVGLWANRGAQITGLDRPEQVDALLVSDGFLPLLRVDAAVGRRFTAEDDRVDAPRTIMISHGFWERTFGGDPGVVGRSLTVNGDPSEIIGVLPPDFEFLDSRPEILFPPRFDPADIRMGNFSYQAIGRLVPGATREEAVRELNGLIRVAVERYPGPISMSMLEQARMANLVRPLKEDMVGTVRSVLWILLGSVGLLLLVACANVANLFLVRAEGRVRQMALRKALGADRVTIARAFLSESVLLGIVAGILGLGLAWVGLEILTRMAPAQLPRLSALELDGTVLTFTAAISVSAGVLFGLFALVRYGNPELTSSLKEGGRGGTGRERHRARNALVTAQVALAMVLLVGSGLMVRSFQSLRTVDPGFDDPEQLLAFRAGIPSSVIEDPMGTARAHEQMLANLRALPGVEAAGAASSVTLDGYDSNDAVFVEDHPTPQGQIPPVRRVEFVLPGYFDTMGNPVLAGRDLDWTDIHETRRVVLVTENLAREYWSSPREALGRRIGRLNLEGEAEWSEIVGVVGNVRDDGLDQPPTPTTFWPQLRRGADGELEVQRGMAFVVRAPEGVLNTLLPQIREAVWSVTASVPLSDVATQAERMRDALARTSFILVLLSVAAAVGLLLGAVGIYGVISYSVSQRTREIGLRMALGAEGRGVAGMMLREGLVLAAAGIVLGVAAAALLTRLMATLIYGVEPLDPATFATVALVLTAVAALASWLPARRASAVDPAVSLRAE